jgi:soluble lytic murein transglycosylase-like protein
VTRRSFQVSVAWLIAIIIALVLVFTYPAPPVSAASQVKSVASEPAAEPVRLPDVPVLYRLMVEREAADVWGINAPTARIAGQIHQESLWDPEAQSRYADGMAQFTPATAEWIAKLFPRQLGDFDPMDPAQAVRAMVIYDHWLLQQLPDAATECDRWAFALSSYNGGLGWLKRDRRRASAKGADAARWFEHVEAHSARAGWAIKENRHYVRVILKRWEPAYIAAGWSGKAVCS